MGYLEDFAKRIKNHDPQKSAQSEDKLRLALYTLYEKHQEREKNGIKKFSVEYWRAFHQFFTTRYAGNLYHKEIIAEKDRQEKARIREEKRKKKSLIERILHPKS